MDDLLKDVEKVFYASIGTAKYTIEKAQTFIDEMSEKGKETVANCKVKNEELKRDIKEKVDKVVTVKVEKEEDPTVDDILDKINQMSEEDRKSILDRLNKASDPVNETEE